MWTARKASNIALIKYMGKMDSQKNKPVNGSLSWTLDHLLTTVTLERSENIQDHWQPLGNSYPFQMTERRLEKYLSHFQNLKKYFGVKDCFKIKSGNNFPADCGVASSASSFAALTEAGCLALSEITSREISLFEKAQLSAWGSGSSSRSFLTGWVYWDGYEIMSLETPFSSLLHIVVLVSDKPKEVSSSQAHQNVLSSLLFHGRDKRAESRLAGFKKNLLNHNWAGLYSIAWQEFWDMHSLFETSDPCFGYLLPESLRVLRKARQLWLTRGDGPLITMDAGPNIHLLFRPDQDSVMLDFFNNHLKNHWPCLSNHRGIDFSKDQGRSTPEDFTGMKG